MLYDASPGLPSAVIKVVKLDGSDEVPSTDVSETIWTVITGSDDACAAFDADLVVTVVVGVAVSRTSVDEPAIDIVGDDRTDGNGSFAATSLEFSHVSIKH